MLLVLRATLFTMLPSARWLARAAALCVDALAAYLRFGEVQLGNGPVICNLRSRLRSDILTEIGNVTRDAREREREPPEVKPEGHQRGETNGKESGKLPRKTPETHAPTQAQQPRHEDKFSSDIQASPQPWVTRNPTRARMWTRGRLGVTIASSSPRQSRATALRDTAWALRFPTRRRRHEGEYRGRGERTKGRD